MNQAEHDNLYERSIDIILENQAASGGYLASPNFPSYRYCWFRDGSFIAYAMDLAGEQGSATRFHDWAARALNQRSGLIQEAVRKASQGEPLSSADILHTRYHLDGSEAVEQEWPNFQLDGFGTWLWALGEHVQRNPAPLPEHWRCAGDLIAAYLTALWSIPCYDLWEEFPNTVHTHTLAALYAGLQSHAQLTGSDHSATLQSIRGYILDHSVSAGHFIKFPGSTDVDASLLGLSVPYGVVSQHDPIMRETVEKIEETIQSGGGVHRYPTDTYYGGGEWVLLAGWLGWHHARNGKVELAIKLLRWIESQADAEGNLPEQVSTHLLAPEYFSIWKDRWGPVANPLLWSHAMYLILHQEIHNKSDQ